MNAERAWTRKEVKRVVGGAVRRSAQQVRASTTAAYTPLTRQLGESDLRVPEVCLGTMTWGQQNTEAEAHAQMSYALDRGVNFMDAAEMYPVPAKQGTQGLTEKYIGTWLKHQKRDQIIIASKVAGKSERMTYLRDNGIVRVTKADIQEGVDKILRRLGTDYVDLLQVHWPDRYVSLFGAKQYDEAEAWEAVPFEEQLEGMKAVIDAGKVRHVGVSNETSFGVMEFIRCSEQYGLPRMISIQNGYSMINRGQFETNLSECCAKRNCNVGLLAYSPLAGGALTGKYNEGDVEGARLSLFPGYMSRFRTSLALDAVKEYTAIAQRHGLTPTQLALAWCKSRWFVTSTIIGATTMDQLEENIDAFGVELDEEIFQEIDAVNKKYRDPAMF
ncbi:aldo/keto reductase [Chloropicon primus]|uniref:Aldo/keto reductase n=1 Tax=Chloropicon primus TaxID=1764295 RepID=A0A5B8MHJ8_9CHLO|nr:aldo/keto reductase [Chloropicon primus]UPQ98333.1 aldo/keto reductase [Chloropicon primus]|eukprot:QDZ19125.1 aldo/keto reductase [Chloropicon primus]